MKRYLFLVLTLFLIGCAPLSYEEERALWEAEHPTPTPTQDVNIIVWRAYAEDMRANALAIYSRELYLLDNQRDFRTSDGMINLQAWTAEVEIARDRAEMLLVEMDNHSPYIPDCADTGRQELHYALEDLRSWNYKSISTIDSARQHLLLADLKLMCPEEP
jgi:hypothetical protein